MRKSVAEVTEFIARVLQNVGLPSAEAYVAARLMAEADARGADGHGIFRLPQYVKRIQSGGINTRPNIHTIQDHPATVQQRFRRRFRRQHGVHDHGCVGPGRAVHQCNSKNGDPQ